MSFFAFIFNLFMDIFLDLLTHTIACGNALSYLLEMVKCAA